MTVASFIYCFEGLRENFQPSKHEPVVSGRSAITLYKNCLIIGYVISVSKEACLQEVCVVRCCFLNLRL